MEPVQRLIIGNNVYDANDDELESEVTSYLGNLVQKQKTAKDGKDAIITATQNRTGKPITTNTYAEVVDKINAISMNSLKIPNLLFRSKFANRMESHYQEIIDNKKVRFSDFDTFTVVGDVAFFSKYSRDVLHSPTNSGDGITLSIQVNLDFGTASANLTPILTVHSEQEPTLYNISIAKVDNTTIKVQYPNTTMGREYDTITVPDMSNFNYFGVDIICLPTGNRININMFGGTRQASETSESGMIPASKVKLFGKTYTSKFASYVLNVGNPIDILVCGNDYAMDGARTFVKTALYLHDFGVRLKDKYETSVVGNTTFLDMEVTS